MLRRRRRRLAGSAGLVAAVVVPPGLAVLVVQKDKADGDGADAEEEDGYEAELNGLGKLVHAGHALPKPDLDVDAAAKGEDHADGAAVHLAHRHDDDDAEEHRDAGQEVEAKGLEGGEVAEFRVREDDEIGNLLRDLVGDGRHGDVPCQGARARGEGGADEDAVAEVVHKVTNEHARTDAGRGLSNGDVEATLLGVRLRGVVLGHQGLGDHIERSGQACTGVAPVVSVCHQKLRPGEDGVAHA